MTSPLTMALYDLIGLRRRYDVIDTVPLIADILRVNVILLQIKRLYKIFLGFG